LYYAVESLDTRLTPPVDSATASQVRAALGDVERFLDADARRDDGGHIRRRIASMTRTLAGG
jgi:hypothetical protein